MLESQVHASTPEFYLGSGYWTQALVLVLWALCSWLSSPPVQKDGFFFKRKKVWKVLNLHQKETSIANSECPRPTSTVFLHRQCVTCPCSMWPVQQMKTLYTYRKTLQCATVKDTGSFWSLAGLSLSHLETNSLRRLFLCFKQGLLFCPPGRPVLLL